MTRSYWRSSCCNAPLDSYKETECPVCGQECVAEPTDYPSSADAPLTPDVVWGEQEVADAPRG